MRVAPLVLVAIWCGQAAAQQAAQQQQTSPLSSRAWSDSIVTKPAPKRGCFTATYPQSDWQETPCDPPPKILFTPKNGPRPFIIGNTNDIAAEAPSGGTITQAIGRFESVTNVTSVASPNGSGTPVNNAYSLQINTNPMTTAACSGSPNTGCRGFQQFVFSNNGSAGGLLIQYWLLFYNAPCPTGWGQFSFSGSTTIYCVRNAADSKSTPNEPITNMSNWTFSGSATASGDSMAFSNGTTAWNVTGDNFIGASAGWTQAEFNIFGNGGDSSGGGSATFNAGASVNARTRIVHGGNAAPNCVATGFTGETNNLSFGPSPPSATAPGPAVIFTESMAGGAASNCAAAVTVGDTHLRTFDGLFYDFQASGDFTLAAVDPGFEVQTRQVSGAPTWPDASVNSAVAARFGTTQVAICLAPPGRDGMSAVFVDGKVADLEDGVPMYAPGVGIRRTGDIYDVVGEDGDSIHVTLHSKWLDVSVGLGRWPSTVKGLIANANGNIDQIATRDGHVLTNPFNFSDLYGRFAESWRVADKDSMLAVCSGGKPAARGAPRAPFFAEHLPAALRDKARGICLAAGVKQGVLLDACTLDVAVLDDPTAADVFVDMAMPGSVGRFTGPGTPGGGGGTGSGGMWTHCRWLLLALIVAVLIILWLLRRRK